MAHSKNHNLISQAHHPSKYLAQLSTPTTPITETLPCSGFPRQLQTEVSAEPIMSSAAQTPVAFNLDVTPPQVATEFQVVEKNEAFDVTADMQGDQNVRLGVTNDRVIHIVSEKKTEEGSNSDNSTATGQQEPEVSRQRAVPLPASVDETKVTASYKDGELHMNLPKRADATGEQDKATAAEASAK